MAKITNQECRYPDAIFMVRENGISKIANYFTNEAGQGIVEEENAVLVTDKFSIAMETLRFLKQKVILTCFKNGKQHDHSINPELFEYSVSEWINFRMLGKFPITNNPVLDDFYLWVTRTNVGFSFITRSEWEEVIRTQGYNPVIVEVGHIRRYVINTGDALYFAEVRIDENVLPIRFNKIVFGNSVKLTRRLFPDLFKDLPFECDEIELIPEKTNTGFNIVARCFSNSSGLIKRFDFNDQKIHTNHLDMIKRVVKDWHLQT